MSFSKARKKPIYLVIGVFMALAFMLGLSPSSVFAVAEETTKEAVKFGVVSDTHIGATGHGISVLDALNGGATSQQRLNTVLDWFTTQGVDAFSIVGDVTTGGTAAQFTNLGNCLKGHLPASVERIITMGNHDNNSWANFENATGCKANDHKIINGYHFIMVSPGSGTIDPLTGRASGTSTGSYITSWVAEQIAIAEADPEAAGKPIFVFFHHPIRGTFYVSEEWNSGSWGNGANNIFLNHPQVVTFSGHIHSPNNDPRSIWQDGGFTAVNTVTTFYYEMESGYIGNANFNSTSTYPKPDGAAIQGLLVSVEGTVVEIKNYDFVSNQFIEQTWTFDVCEPLPYTNARVENAQKPVFSTKDVTAVTGKINLTSFSSSGVTATFDQAFLPRMSEVGETIHSYRFEIINRNTGQIVANKKQWSDFMHAPMQPRYSQTINGLSANTPYEMRIYAYGSFQQESDQYLTVSFTGNVGVDPDQLYSYTVSFDSNGGSEVEPAVVEDGEILAKPEDPEKEGYAFLGWFNGEDEFDFASPITENIRLIAKWEQIINSVNFDVDGATTTELVVYGDTVIKPEDPEKEGYIFLGWTTDVEIGTLYNFDVAVTESMTLYALWEKAPEEVVLEGVISAASVKKLNGSKNDLTIVVTEFFTDGSENTISKTFSINNNAAGTYSIGDYKVFVDTKGNVQIRACYFVD